MDKAPFSGVVQIWMKWDLYMAERDRQLREVLDGCAKVFQDKEFELDKRQPYLVRWVRNMLLLARAHGGPPRL